MKLYDYFRSTACYRVRIALHIKNIPYEKIPIHLINNGGEQNSNEYYQKNPQKLVPSLEIDGQIINQSLAIIEYLDELFPEIPLLPGSALDRAHVRSLALMIACEIHPLNNLRVLNYLKKHYDADEEKNIQWYHHWLKTGFDAFEEKLLRFKRIKPLCYGDNFTLADICLIPQVYNAHRFNFPMEHYPIINEINEYCLKYPAFSY